MKIRRVYMERALATLTSDLRSLLDWRVQLLRGKGYERSCDYGQTARDEIHELVAACAAVKEVLASHQIALLEEAREPRTTSETAKNLTAERCFMCNNDGMYYAPDGDAPMVQYYCRCAAGVALRKKDLWHLYSLETPERVWRSLRPKK